MIYPYNVSYPVDFHPVVLTHVVSNEDDDDDDEDGHTEGKMHLDPDPFPGLGLDLNLNAKILNILPLLPCTAFPHQHPHPRHLLVFLQHLVLAVFPLLMKTPMMKMMLKMKGELREGCGWMGWGAIVCVF